MERYCEYCGKDIRNDAVFCPFCGSNPVAVTGNSDRKEDAEPIKSVA